MQIEKEEPMEMLYLSRQGCGVCSAIRPRIRALAQQYPQCTLREIDLDEEPAAAGAYSVFTIPAVLVFIDGRESIREARFFDMDDLTARFDRLYSLRFQGDDS